MIGDDKKAPPDSESFAALIGQTKPIENAPARVERTGLRARPRVGDSEHASHAAFRWPDPDEPRMAGASGVSDAQLLALGRGEPEPEERIDLHGLRSAAAARVIAQRIQTARSQGLLCVIVIHGHGSRSESGQAILRDALPKWLTSRGCRDHVLGFAPAPKRLGGLGATLVLLRRG